jgi:hypothetical protein
METLFGNQNQVEKPCQRKTPDKDREEEVHRREGQV